MSDDDNNGRCKRSGRFLKGHSGNKSGARAKADNPLLPHELAASILKIARKPVDVKGPDGKPQRLPAHEVVFHQTTAAATQRDKAARREFNNAVSDATKTLQAYEQRRYQRLGAYLRAIDEGNPWRLNEAEAAALQEIADEAGYPIRIEAYDPNAQAEPITAQMIDAVTSDAKIQAMAQLGLNSAFPPDKLRGLVRRTIHVFEAERAKRRAP